MGEFAAPAALPLELTHELGRYSARTVIEYVGWRLGLDLWSSARVEFHFERGALRRTYPQVGPLKGLELEELERVANLLRS